MVLKVAIIGRANVGKSTLFNRLAGRKIALVHDEPGVTRDRREADADFKGLPLRLIDTAGFEQGTQDSLATRMFTQTKAAIDEADVCLFVIDARAGLHPYDEVFATLMRQSAKPVILIANKCEGKTQEDSIFEAYKLGLGEPIPFSAEHGLGLEDLYTLLKAYLPDEKPDFEESSAQETAQNRPINLAIIGRPNVGKSTLVNALIGQNRMLTGPEAGITRDAIKLSWHYKDQQINLVDTAGLRRHSKITDGVEKMSAAATKHAIGMAEVVVLVLDADAVLDKQDLTIARQVVDEGRALVIAVNKWDIAKRMQTIQTLNDKLQTSLTQIAGVETVTISALKKEGLDSLMHAVLRTYKRWNTRIPTAPLNQWFADVLAQNPLPLGKNKRRIKLKYITQAKTRPPAFFIFSSNPEGLPESYLRYLINSLRDTFDLKGVPVRITLRKSDNPYKDRA
ncbi:MAG: ribosome biogenesis GTPase Der [Alphaproteobacteria bacterium]|nr:ribosome biogenesis GTPase Der [Alphaproteobacteria bacterium]